MSKLSVIAASVAALPVLSLSGSALAAGAPGQIVGSTNLYYGKNLTQNSAYNSDLVSGVCGDTLLLKSRIHNGGPDSAVGNIKVVATLPKTATTQYTSTLTVSSPEADPMSVSDTVTLKSDKAANFTYVSGSTELLAAHNDTVEAKLADGITDNGVTLPSAIKVSVDEKRFVQFQVKLNCETTPPPVTPPTKIKVCELKTKNVIEIDETAFDATLHSKDLTKCAPTPPKENEITVCELSTKKVINIKESTFDSSKHSKDLTKCAATTTTTTTTTPTELVSTGPAGTMAIVAVASALAAAAYNLVTRRSSARQ